MSQFLQVLVLTMSNYMQYVYRLRPKYLFIIVSIVAMLCVVQYIVNIDNQHQYERQIQIIIPSNWKSVRFEEHFLNHRQSRIVYISSGDNGQNYLHIPCPKNPPNLGNVITT